MEVETSKFVSSHEKNFDIYADRIYSAFSTNGFSVNHINGVLIIIKPDNTAEIYTGYPMSIRIVAKGICNHTSHSNCRKLLLILPAYHSKMILRISIRLRETRLYGFHRKMTFWIIFQFSRKQSAVEIMENLGYCYKRVLYQKTFSFLSESDNLEKLASDSLGNYI